MLYKGEESNVSPPKKKQVPSTDPWPSGNFETRDILSSGSSVIQLLTKKNPVVENEDSAPSPKSLSSAVLCASLM